MQSYLAVPPHDTPQGPVTHNHKPQYVNALQCIHAYSLSAATMSPFLNQALPCSLLLFLLRP